MAHFTRTIIIYGASHSVFTSTSKTDEKPREIDAKRPLHFVPRFFALSPKYIFGQKTIHFPGALDIGQKLEF